MIRTYIGTAGWSYEDWKGVVYPEKKEAGFHPLAFLAQYINMVEVNSTFYRPPSISMSLFCADSEKDEHEKQRPTYSLRNKI